ncbi:MAG: hypothetical protein HYW78_02200 [Parcubacteria group bacterium]|nr:hypothetical protein [Parcubacteria group bacterium]
MKCDQYIIKKICTFAVVFFIVSVPLVFAAPALENGLTNVTSPAGLGKKDLTDVIGNVIKIALSFMGVITVLLMIAGGFIWMTSGGAEEKIKKAKKLMVAGVIGLIIVIVSYSITSFVISRFSNIADV